MRLLLKSIEKHHHITFVENEKHPEDVAAVFCPQLENLVAQVFDELGIDSFLCLKESVALNTSFRLTLSMKFGDVP